MPPPELQQGEAAGDVSWRERRELDHAIFSIRDTKELGRAVRERTSWDTMCKFAVGPQTAQGSDRVWAVFQKYCDEHGFSPTEAALLRYAHSALETAGPKTVAAYVRKILHRCKQTGIRGVRTRRVQDTVRALTRMSSAVRSVQAPPVSTQQVAAATKALEEGGDLQAAAFVAMTWLTRSRVPDLRFMTSKDWAELENSGGPPATVGAKLYAKEKGAKEARPGIYLPPGRLTGVAVRFWRQWQGTGYAFGGESGEYVDLKRRIHSALPEGSWLHSLKRGAAHEIEETGVCDEDVSRFLRHSKNNWNVTQKYLNPTNAYRREREKTLLGTLQ